MSNSLSVNGLSVQVHLPPAPEGDGVHGLPPRLPISSYVVDEYNCPPNWMNGSSKASSYFIPVKAGRHLWLDFNQLQQHTHDVAIVLSVQGINPITGKPTKILRLEQYGDNCPEHNQPFKQDRFCEACGYKWPAQNYMTTTSWPRGVFWIDGFRTESGTIRGFLFTEEMMKGVAAQIIGEDRVFAIGIAFYLSKEAKPKPAYSPTRGTINGMLNESVPISTKGLGGYKGGSYSNNSVTPASANMKVSRGPGGSSAGGSRMLRSASLSPSPASYGGEYESLTGGITLGDSGEMELSRSLEVAPKLEIAAGAKITQETCYLDLKKLDYYEDEPHGLIYINYATEGEVKQILAKGQKDTTGGGEGFLKTLVKGNPV